MSQKTMGILKECLPTFTMLADENRQQLLILLFDDGPQSVSELTSKMELSQPAVSHHLRLLNDADLITFKKRGKERIYDISAMKSINLLEALITSMKEDFAERNL